MKISVGLQNTKILQDQVANLIMAKARGVDFKICDFFVKRQPPFQKLLHGCARIVCAEEGTRELSWRRVRTTFLHPHGNDGQFQLRNNSRCVVRRTIPPPVTMIDGSRESSSRSTSLSASRKTSSPWTSKILGTDKPNFAAIISSVSQRGNPVLFSSRRPTENFPAPIKPTKTIARPRSDIQKPLYNAGILIRK